MADSPSALPTLNIGPSAPYLQAQKEYRSAQVNANKILENMLGQNEKTTEELKRSEAAIGKADADARYADQAQAQEKADAAKDVQARFGGDVRDPSSVAAQLALNVREETDVATQMLDGIRRRQSVSVLDDPLQFIFNAIELPQVINDYNTRATKIDAMNADLANLEARSAARTSLAHATIPAISMEQATAGAHKATAQAALNSSKHEMALIGQRTAYAQQALQNIHDGMKAEAGLSQQQMSAASANFASRIDAIKWAESSERRHAETAKATEMLTDLKAKKQAIAIAAKAYGHDPAMFTLSMFERLPATEQFKFMSGAMGGNYGVNPYEAWKNVNTFGGPNLPTTTKEWMRQITGLVQQIRNNTKEETMNPRDAAAYAKDKEGYIAAKLTEELKKLSTASVTEATSFLKELPPAVMAATFTGFDKSVAGTVLSPLMAVPNPTTATVLETIATGLATKGVPTTGQAYAIAQYYIANIDQRNKQSNSEAFKVTLPRSYVVVLNDGNRNMTVDVTKPEQVQLYLLRKFGQQGKALDSGRQPFAETLFPGSTQTFPQGQGDPEAAKKMPGMQPVQFPGMPDFRVQNAPDNYWKARSGE